MHILVSLHSHLQTGKPNANKLTFKNLGKPLITESKIYFAKLSGLLKYYNNLAFNQYTSVIYIHMWLKNKSMVKSLFKRSLQKSTSLLNELGLVKFLVKIKLIAVLLQTIITTFQYKIVALM